MYIGSQRFLCDNLWPVYKHLFYLEIKCVFLSAIIILRFVCSIIAWNGIMGMKESRCLGTQCFLEVCLAFVSKTALHNYRSLCKPLRQHEPVVCHLVVISLLNQDTFEGL